MTPEHLTSDGLAQRSTEPQTSGTSCEAHSSRTRRDEKWTTKGTYGGEKFFWWSVLFGNHNSYLTKHSFIAEFEITIGNPSTFQQRIKTKRRDNKERALILQPVRTKETFISNKTRCTFNIKHRSPLNTPLPHTHTHSLSPLLRYYCVFVTCGQHK